MTINQTLEPNRTPPMIINQLLRTLAASALGAGALDHTARTVRIAGLIPNAGRGGIAPDITAQHLANYLIGLGAADSPARAGVRVAQWSAMPLMGNQGPAFAPPLACFGEVLNLVLEDQRRALLVDELRINRLWPEATFILKEDGRRFRYGGIEATEYRMGNGHVRVEASFSGVLLQQLGASLKEVDAEADD